MDRDKATRLLKTRLAGPGRLGGQHVPDLDPPTITKWRSLAAHGGQGMVGLNIPDDGSSNEPRSSGVLLLAVTFSEVVDVKTLTAGSVAIAGLDVNNDALNLTGITVWTLMDPADSTDTVGWIYFSPALPNCARYTIRLISVTDVAGNCLSGGNPRTYGRVGSPGGPLSMERRSFHPALQRGYTWDRLAQSSHMASMRATRSGYLAAKSLTSVRSVSMS